MSSMLFAKQLLLLEERFDEMMGTAELLLRRQKKVISARQSDQYLDIIT